MATMTRRTAVLATSERFWWGGRQVRSIREDRAGDGFGDDTWVNLYSTTEPRKSSYIASVRPASSASLMNAIGARPWLPRRSYTEA
jgi:hypothetical protein